jgi:hypothetical protein
MFGKTMKIDMEKRKKNLIIFIQHRNENKIDKRKYEFIRLSCCVCREMKKEKSVGKSSRSHTPIFIFPHHQKEEKMRKIIFLLFLSISMNLKSLSLSLSPCLSFALTFQGCVCEKVFLFFKAFHHFLFLNFTFSSSHFTFFFDV